jgi:hypothetical protein
MAANLLFLLPITTFTLVPIKFILFHSFINSQGCWQVKRLFWKLDLIEFRNKRASGPPTDLPLDVTYAIAWRSKIGFVVLLALTVANTFSFFHLGRNIRVNSVLFVCFRVRSLACLFVCSFVRSFLSFLHLPVPSSLPPMSLRQCVCEARSTMPRSS